MEANGDAPKFGHGLIQKVVKVFKRKKFHHSAKDFDCDVISSITKKMQLESYPDPLNLTVNYISVNMISCTSHIKPHYIYWVPANPAIFAYHYEQEYYNIVAKILVVIRMKNRQCTIILN